MKRFFLVSVLILFGSLFVFCAFALFMPERARNFLFEINWGESPAAYHWSLFNTFLDKDFRDEQRAEKHLAGFVKSGERGVTYLLGLIRTEIDQNRSRPQHLGRYHTALTQMKPDALPVLREQIDAEVEKWEQAGDLEKHRNAVYLFVLCIEYWVCSQDLRYASIWCETQSYFDDDHGKRYAEYWMLALSQYLEEMYPGAPDIFDKEEFCRYLTATAEEAAKK